MCILVNIDIKSDIRISYINPIESIVEIRTYLIYDIINSSTFLRFSYHFNHVMKDVVVLPGPSSIELGNSIASCLNVDPVEVELRTFSDGESKITN